MADDWDDEKWQEPPQSRVDPTGDISYALHMGKEDCAYNFGRDCDCSMYRVAQSLLGRLNGRGWVVVRETALSSPETPE